MRVSLGIPGPHPELKLTPNKSKYLLKSVRELNLLGGRRAESHLSNMSLWGHIVLGHYTEKGFKVIVECFSLKFLKTFNSFSTLLNLLYF